MAAQLMQEKDEEHEQARTEMEHRHEKVRTLYMDLCCELLK